MSLSETTYLVVGTSFALYIFIALRSRAGSTQEFYVAGKGIHPVANGMATAADWMSAASFISMAGLIGLSYNGYGGSVFLMGWTGGYVILAMLIAPYLRKYGKFTVPEFIGDRYYSDTARVVAVICLIICSVTYVIGQMKGIGVAFSRFLETDYETGLFSGMVIVFFYAVLGGMKGITYTQVAQYCVMIFALYQLWKDHFIEQAMFIYLAISCYFVTTLISAFKFGELPSYHTLGAKVAALLLAPSYYLMVLFDAEFFFRSVIIFYILVAFEELSLPLCLNGQKRISGLCSLYLEESRTDLNGF